jgi:DNA-binding response OmpR family regulator
MRALIVEDDPRLRGVISRSAVRAGLAVDDTATLNGAEALMELHQYDLLVLDRRLPDGDGLEVCRKARQRGFGNSILMVTALDDPDSIVDGLADGADDYLGKPFDLDVLEARMKALLRRNHRRPTAELQFGDLSLRSWERRVLRDGVEIQMTSREFAIFEALMQMQGGIISRTDLLERAWGEREEPMSNTIDVLVARIRKKLGASGSLVHVETLRGSGYRLRIS